MKQKDLYLIAVVVIVSAALSYIAVNKLIPNTKPKIEKAEKVDPIVADFNLPPEKYFNQQAINPTRTIRIGENDNDGPF